MSVISFSDFDRQRCAEFPALRAPAAGRGYPLALLPVLIAAVLLRCLRMDAIFETSDQAAMPYLVRHGFGLKWIFAHDYGPVPALLQAVWARLLWLLGLPIAEAAARMPIAMLSLAQVAITWPLLLRLRCSRLEALAGTVLAALLPPLVCDAHYAWGYHTVWLLAGSAALWATLAFLDGGRWLHLAVAGVCLFLHCLSALYAFALPLTLMLAWWWGSAARTADAHSGGPVARPDTKSLAAGFLLPCFAAVAVILASWAWTGGGQLGRLLVKRQMGTVGLQAGQLLELPAMLSSQIGYVLAAAGALALPWAVRGLLRRYRVGLLALWALAGLLPSTLLADWACVGYPNYYLFESYYALAMLAAVGLVRAGSAARLRPAAAVVMLAICLQLVAAGVQIVHPDARLRRLSGIHTGWGDVRVDSGIKAAGWYVRQFVPLDATVLCLHTRGGMELPVAEYYCGRKVLAHYDLPPQVIPILLERIGDCAAVIITDPEHEPFLTGSDLRLVSSIRNEGRLVRRIYARQDLHLPPLDADAGSLNAAFDLGYTPRRVPLPLPAGREFLTHLRRYQQTLENVGATRFNLVRDGAAATAKVVTVASQ